MEAKKKALPIDNPQSDPAWRPYCLVCDTMMRMEKTDYGYKCRACRNEINRDLTHHSPVAER